MTLRDTLERLWWTFLSAALATLGAGSLIGIAVWQSALVAGATAVINLLTIIARARLDALPNPGNGLPGLPTGGDS